MKTTITILTLSLLLLWADTSIAADCKYQWDTSNYRTGEKVLWTRWERNKRITSPVSGLLAAVQEGDRRYFALQTVTVERHSDVRPTKADIDSAMIIPDNAKLSILFADGSIYDLFSENEVIGDTSIVVNGSEPDDHFVMGRRSGYTYSSRAIVKFPLDAEDIATLSAQKATDMRLHGTARNYDITFGSKPSDKIQDVVACIPPLDQ